jgi:hypothetical protein
MNGLSLAQRLAVAEFLSRHFGTTVRKGQLNPEAAASMDIGERHSARFVGERVAWVSMPAPATRAGVDNEAALLAWTRKHLPGEVETVERVRPATLKRLGEEMKSRGGWVNPDGELIPVDGIRVSTSDPSPRVELEDCAEDAIRAAWLAGEIDLGELLALPVAEPELEPMPLMIEKTPFGPPFCDEHGFLNPVMAAAHAIMVQGGDSTPPVEAYRMLRDGAVGAERALAWMKEHGLDPADPREGKDTPWPLPAIRDAVPEPAPEADGVHQ